MRKMSNTKKNTLDKVAKYVLESWQLMFCECLTNPEYKDFDKFNEHTKGLMNDMFDGVVYGFENIEFSDYDKFYVQEEVMRLWISSMDEDKITMDFVICQNTVR